MFGLSPLANHHLYILLGDSMFVVLAGNDYNSKFQDAKIQQLEHLSTMPNPILQLCSWHRFVITIEFSKDIGP